ncbi:MAG: hypothetical protein ABIH03_04650 [Pseudomonadota bacterium]
MAILLRFTKAPPLTMLVPWSPLPIKNTDRNGLPPESLKMAHTEYGESNRRNALPTGGVRRSRAAGRRHYKPTKKKSMTDNETDAAVAREVMGLNGVELGHADYWFNPCQCGYHAERGGMCGRNDKPAYIYRSTEAERWDFVPCYTSDVAADYEVLDHVRRNWKSELVCDFRDSVKCTWDARAQSYTRGDGIGVWGLTQYQPGDYARAALAIIRIERNKP